MILAFQSLIMLMGIMLLTKYALWQEHMNELSLICSRQYFGSRSPVLGHQYCKSKLVYVEKMAVLSGYT